MYRYTDHERKRMLSRGINEEDVHETIEKGELEFTKKDEIGRGTEYTHSFESKESYPRKIMVGWTYDKKDILIMTVYEVKKNRGNMTIICGKCEKEMKEIELKEYEFEEGIILDNVRAMQCPSGHVTFTEEQADILEQRTEDIKTHSFKFIRSISKSARSLVIRIPTDLAKYMEIDEKSKVEMIPLSKKRFLIEVK